MSRTKLTQNSIAAGAINANTMFAADIIGPHAIANTATYSVGELLVGGTILLDNTGVITGPSSITSTAFVGTLSTAAQPNITSVGTLTAFRSTGIDDNSNALAMTIDSSERVGIGTASPSSTFHVTGAGVPATITSTNNAFVLKFLQGSSSTAYIGTNNNALILAPSTGAIGATLTATGLGIGTSAPKTRLQSTGAGALNAPSLGNASANAPLYLTNSDSAYGLVVGTHAGTGHVWLQAQRTDGTATAYNITLNEAGGNVGIGTTTPGDRLDLNISSTSTNPVFGGTSDQGIRLKNTSATAGNFTSILNINSAGTLSSMIAFRNVDHSTPNTAGAIDFVTRNGGTLYRAMTIAETGNVGIGTSAPGALLEINHATVPKIRFARVGSYYWDIGHTASDFQFVSQTGGTVLHLNYDGNVGIGTSAPTTDLTVAGVASANQVYNTDPVLLLSKATGTRVANEGVSLGFNSGTAFLYGAIKGSATNSAAEYGGYLSFYTTAASSYHAERMRITEDGLVGIGTATPGTKLEIYTGSTTTDGLKISRYPTGTYYSTLRQAAHGLAIHAGDGTNISESAAITPNGITFNGDTAAANALNDYEEGTFTATLGGSTVAGSSPTTAGAYVKIGKIVTIDFAFQNVTVSGASGLNTISGLPFAPVLAQNQAGAQWSYNMTVGGHHTVWHLTGTNMYSYNTVNNLGWTSNAVRNSNGQYAWHTFTYRVA